MGKEFIVHSLEEMCMMMCDNYIPQEETEDDSDRVSRNWEEHDSTGTETELPYGVHRPRE